MNEDTICGVNAVAALFDRRPDEVKRLFYVAAAKEAVGPHCAVLAQARKPYRMVPPEELRDDRGDDAPWRRRRHRQGAQDRHHRYRQPAERAAAAGARRDRQSA
jgi:tRNA G18 (ribose-2'-O)-methylase SpoU